MSTKPYDSFKKEELILRDLLAVDRTILVNETTFLAYIRTALTFSIGGISFIKFFDIPFVKVLGWIFIPTGISIFLIGIWRYRKIKKDLHRIKMKE